MRVLTLGHVVLYSPGSVPIIASANSAQYLPMDMVTTLGAPQVIADSQELLEMLYT